MCLCVRAGARRQRVPRGKLHLPPNPPSLRLIVSRLSSDWWRGSHSPAHRNGRHCRSICSASHCPTCAGRGENAGLRRKSRPQDGGRRAAAGMLWASPAARLDAARLKTRPAGILLQRFSSEAEMRCPSFPALWSVFVW